MPNSLFSPPPRHLRSVPRRCNRCRHFQVITGGMLAEVGMPERLGVCACEDCPDYGHLLASWHRCPKYKERVSA